MATSLEQRMPVAMRVKRDELEIAIEKLYGRKAGMEKSDYLKALERLLVEIAELYKKADALANQGTQEDVDSMTVSNSRWAKDNCRKFEGFLNDSPSQRLAASEAPPKSV